MSKTYTYVANLMEQTTDVPGNSIISRSVHDDDNAKTILFTFAAGQELSEHTASMPATLYFMQGEADLILGSDAMEAKAGTWVHMPPNLPHSVHAKTDVLMLLTLVKAG